MTLDNAVIILLEACLVGLGGVALYKDRCHQLVRRFRKPQRATDDPAPNHAPSAEPQAIATARSEMNMAPHAIRGEVTMGIIAGAYATSVGACYSIISMSTSMDDGRAALMAMDTLLLCYLFFFSGWWRNRVLLPWHERIRKH